MKTNAIRRAASETPKKQGAIRSIPALPFKVSINLDDVIHAAREIQIETGYEGWNGTARSRGQKPAAAENAKHSRTPAKKK